MNENDPRPFQAISIDMASSESGRERFLKDGHIQAPPIVGWRCNLTALSQRYNLYFMASRSGVAVYTPEFPFQKLRRKAKLYIPPTLADPSASGYIDAFEPHSINHLAVGDLGTEEILLVVTDSGNVTGYHTKAINEAIKQEPYRFSNDARSDCVGLRAFFAQSVQESAWGLAIHKEARMIAVSSNVPHHRSRGAPDLFAKVTVFAFALSSRTHDSNDDASLHEAEEDMDEAEWRPWRSETASPDSMSRDHNYRIDLCDHRSNVPSVSFVNTAQDPHGAWLLSTDISGCMKMWNVWSGTCRRSWYFGAIGDISSLGTQSQLDEEAGWVVAVLDPAEFRKAQTMEQFCGHYTAPKIEEGRESYDISRIVRLTVPGRSHKHPFLHAEAGSVTSSDDGSADVSDDEGELVADHWSEDEDEAIAAPSVNLDAAEIDASQQQDDIVPTGNIEERPLSATDTARTPGTADDGRDVEDILLDAYNSDLEATDEDVENDSDAGEADSLHDAAVHDESDEDEAHSSSSASFASETSLSHVSSVEVEIEPLAITSPGPRASPDGQQESAKSKKRSRNETNSSISEGTIPDIPILHCSTNHLRLLNVPRERRAHLFCSNILQQQLPRTQFWRNQARPLQRVNMFQQIPELGIVVVASQLGRCAICALTRHPETETYGLRVDWIVPTKRQEKSGGRPSMWLLGIATAPVQGHWIGGESRTPSEPSLQEDSQFDGTHISFDTRMVSLPDPGNREGSGNEDEEPSTSANKRPRRSSSNSSASLSEGDTAKTPWKRPQNVAVHTRPNANRRYRLMMTYADFSVLTYEISRDPTREGSDATSVFEC